MHSKLRKGFLGQLPKSPGCLSLLGIEAWLLPFVLFGWCWKPSSTPKTNRGFVFVVFVFYSPTSCQQNQGIFSGYLSGRLIPTFRLQHAYSPERNDALTQRVT